MSIRKREVTEKLQDALGTKVGGLDLDEAIFINKMYPLYDRIKYLGEITGTSKLPIIKNALKRVREFGLHKSLEGMNDRTQLTAFLTRKRKLRKKGHGILYEGAESDEFD